MTGAKLITALKRKFRVSNDTALANHTGVSIPAVQMWKNRRSVTPRQIASLVHKASYQSNVIRPVVEMFPIARSESRQGASYEIFSSSRDDKTEHLYRKGLKEQLSEYHGIYIFYDSRGRAIYAGKARRQSLWKEMNLAFNRDRGEVQSIKRVSHPARSQHYDVEPRRIVGETVVLHELATYLSAYHVPDAMINDLESMLVRSFANDLLNIKIERFSH